MNFLKYFFTISYQFLFIFHVVKNSDNKTTKCTILFQTCLFVRMTMNNFAQLAE